MEGDSTGIVVSRDFKFRDHVLDAKPIEFKIRDAVKLYRDDGITLMNEVTIRSNNLGHPPRMDPDYGSTFPIQVHLQDFGIMEVMPCPKPGVDLLNPRYS